MWCLDECMKMTIQHRKFQLVAYVGLFDNTENIVDMNQISVENIDDTYHIISVKWYKAYTYVCMYVYFISKSVNILYNTTQEYILYNIIQR